MAHAKKMSYRMREHSKEKEGTCVPKKNKTEKVEENKQQIGKLKQLGERGRLKQKINKYLKAGNMEEQLISRI